MTFNSSSFIFSSFTLISNGHVNQRNHIFFYAEEFLHFCRSIACITADGRQPVSGTEEVNILHYGANIEATYCLVTTSELIV